ncbi:MAG TPA: hypothetical protein VE074_12465 [Jatrophihabitantaceae bacterium]|nr:hypothetical protein [Jatrophihabitantaceae bacterium]
MTEPAPVVYSDLVKTLLDIENGRRTSLEQKGAAVITTSGTLVTLLFGLVAVITSADTFVLPGDANGPLVAALILFVVACGFAIMISVPLPYGQSNITIDDLAQWWGDSNSQALAAVAGLRLRAIDVARRRNAVKVALLLAALLSELAALVLLTVAVLAVVQAR